MEKSFIDAFTLRKAEGVCVSRAKIGSVIQVILDHNPMVWLIRTTSRYQGGQQQTMNVRDACPQCASQQFTKNGHTHDGKQNHQCKACGQQGGLDTGSRVIAEEQRRLVELLRCEKISLHGMCRAVGVRIRWLMRLLVPCFAALPDHLHVQPVAAPRDGILGWLEVEADRCGAS